MAISAESLKGRIISEMTSVLGAPDDPSQLEKVAEAIAKAVVDEIKTNAQASGTCNVSSGSSAGQHPVTIPPGGIT